MIILPDLIEQAAELAHTANLLYCKSIGDHSQQPWSEAPEWQKDSARKGVKGVLIDGNGPGASHEGWLAEKIATGWKYGPVKDAEEKEHPAMVSYADLPPEQKEKDRLFVSIVMAFGTSVKAVQDYYRDQNGKET